MKTRLGHVTNSSSSSFVTINNTNMLPVGFGNGKHLKIGEVGCTEFGWQTRVYSDFHDKVNFAWLQTQQPSNEHFPDWGSKPEWTEMLRRALIEYAGFSYESIIVDDYDTEQGMVWGYIDHQSSAREGENTEIFDDYETLCNFLFSRDSRIHNDNDNHGY